MDRRFKIEGEITRQYRRFNAVGTQLTVRLRLPIAEEEIAPPSAEEEIAPPSAEEEIAPTSAEEEEIAPPLAEEEIAPPPAEEEETAPSSAEENPVSYFLASVRDLFENALRDVSDSDMVGITIQNEVNLKDKAIGISFRRKDQLSGDVIWSVFEKVAQSNANFNALDKLVVTVHSVRTPVGFGRGVRARGRPISVMAHLKRSIVEVKAEENCLANALIIGIARLNKDPKYESYRKGYRIRPVV